MEVLQDIGLWSGYVLWALVLIVASLFVYLGLGGTFIIIGLALVHALVTGFDPITWKLLLWLLGLALFGLVVLIDVFEKAWDVPVALEAALERRAQREAQRAALEQGAQPPLADTAGPHLRLHVLADDVQPDVGEDQVPDVLAKHAPLVDLHRRDAQRLLPHLRGVRVVAAAHGPPDVGLVALRRRTTGTTRLSR